MFITCCAGVFDGELVTDVVARNIDAIVARHHAYTEKKKIWHREIQ
jgi:hypothetical protein